MKTRSSDFENNGIIPIKFTYFGDNIPPTFELVELNENAISIAVVMDDLDVPFTASYNHFIVWNIPKTNILNIEYYNKGVIGIGYGKNKYKGPNPPFFIRKRHRYSFNIYLLDIYLNISKNSSKNELLKAKENHILDNKSYYGTFSRMDLKEVKGK